MITLSHSVVSATKQCTEKKPLTSRRIQAAFCHSAPTAINLSSLPFQKAMANLTLEHGSLILTSNYEPRLVAEIKLLPYSERRWDPARRVWVISPQHGRFVAGLVAKYLGEMVMIPQVGSSQARTERRILEVRYIGTTKDRGDGQPTAFGYCRNEWSVVFPEIVLMEWFTGQATTTQKAGSSVGTLYEVLGIPRTAGAEEIKAAYRRMVKHTHPDVNKEPDAEQQFIRVQQAYEMLGDPNKRARYDAGLALEQTVHKSTPWDRASVVSHLQSGTGYRSPLRCGLIIAEGHEELGRFVVSKIEQWADITDRRGHVLVTSWPAGAQTFTEQWV